MQFQVELMILTELHGNLFEHIGVRTPVHCISQDCKMGAGIAPLMKSTFNLWGLYSKVKECPSCVYYNGVFNLITKKNYYDKPTYDTLERALASMKNYILVFNIQKLIMPKIGCGLDRLQWPRVREMLENIFRDTNIDILVCYL